MKWIMYLAFYYRIKSKWGWFTFLELKSWWDGQRCWSWFSHWQKKR